MTTDITKTEEEWLQRKWRPAVAVAYIVICSFDFILFPIAWAIFLQVTGHKVVAWEPLTLQGAGLFHASFGAILGVAAYSRGTEKTARNNTLATIYRAEGREVTHRRYDPPV